MIFMSIYGSARSKVNYNNHGTSSRVERNLETMTATQLTIQQANDDKRVHVHRINGETGRITMNIIGANKTGSNGVTKLDGNINGINEIHTSTYSSSNNSNSSDDGNESQTKSQNLRSNSMRQQLQGSDNNNDFNNNSDIGIFQESQENHNFVKPCVRQMLMSGINESPQSLTSVAIMTKKLDFVPEKTIATTRRIENENIFDGRVHKQVTRHPELIQLIK